MIEPLAFLLADGNLPFTISLAVMFLIATIEGVGMFIGWQASAALEMVLPDLDVDVEAPDFQGGALSRLLGWLRVGKVPVLMLLVVFLTAFGLIGLAVQAAADDLLGSPLPAALASVPAFLAALPVVRVLGSALHRVIPKDETSAVSADSLIGKVARITLGNATQGSPAQAKLTDGFGTTHYVMVEPDLPEESFAQGDAVVLVSRAGVRYRAIRNTSAALTD